MVILKLLLSWVVVFGVNLAIVKGETPHRRPKGVPRDPFHEPVGQTRYYQHYYGNLTEKMRETMDGTCTFVHSGEDSNKHADLVVDVLHPSAAMVERWKSVPPSQTWFDPNICKGAEKFFRQIVGCTRGVALHPDCPRCHRERTEKVCKMATGEPLIIPEALKTRQDPDVEASSPWIATGHNAYVARCGAVSLPCGGVMTRTQCGGIRDEDGAELRDRCFPNGNPGAFSLPPNECSNATVYDRVFIMSYKYDNAIGHFLTEVLPRLAFHFDLLTDKKRPVHIHYGCDSKFGSFSPPLKYISWLGLDRARLVQGEVFAKEIMVPREGACQDLMFNRWEFLKMRDMVLARAGLGARVNWAVRKVKGRGRVVVEGTDGNVDAPVVAGKPIMLVLQRSRSQMSARRGDVTRLWPTDFFEKVLTAIETAFPEYDVTPFSDKNHTMLNCIECQLDLFTRSTVMVGMHGAGLSNMMFMPIGATLVEITPGLDGRMLPGSGPFSRVAMASGVHHVYHHLLKDMQVFSRHGTTFDPATLIEVMQRALPVIGN